MDHDTIPSASSYSDGDMSETDMDMIDLEIETERELLKQEQQEQAPCPNENESYSEDISAVEQAFNILTISNFTRQSQDEQPHRPTEEELLALEDPHEALQAANASSLSAQLHVEKARQILATRGHVDNASSLGPREKLEVEGRYRRAEQELADAARLKNMAAVWLRKEWERVREKIK